MGRRARGKNENAWNLPRCNLTQSLVGSIPTGNTKQTISLGQKLLGALHPYSAGGAIRKLMMDEGEERVKATYGDTISDLVEIKNKYDR